MKNHSDHDSARETLWTMVYANAVASQSTMDVKICANWADHAVAEFDARFSPEQHAERVETRKIEQDKQKEKDAKKLKKTVKKS